MRINLNWLRDYTSFDFSAEHLADKLTMTSLEAVPLPSKSEFFQNVVVGKVLEVAQHPNADKLTVCQVDIDGDNPKQVICGAPNVAEGQVVPFIRPGTKLPDGQKIDSVKLRGIESHGMIPSEKELGLSDSHAGIMVLTDDAQIGSSFWQYLEKFWSGLDIEITPNRPDCMSHFGVAREVSVLAGSSFNKPEISIPEDSQKVEEIAKVVIHEPDKCPRYAARVIRDVKIEPSPLWLQQRLASIGLRPINNVVDISNYVLMETGHPLHTFDYDTLDKHTIEVRSAKDGEKFTTLDGKERTLSSEILLICDAKQPVAIAGIMGGENSEVTDDTCNLLIESAYFDPTTIRRGSKQLGLSTEASKRFERGTDPEGVIYALDRITALIQEIAGGKVAEGVIDAYPNPLQKKVIALRQSKTRQVLGIAVETERIEKILQDLGFEVQATDKEKLNVTVPSYRPDIEREIDLIEEVLRIHGMWKIPAPHKFVYPAQEVLESDRYVEDTLQNSWKGFGFHHTFSNSLVKKEYTFQNITGMPPVRITNPLGEEMSYMRTTLIPLLLEGVKKNHNRKEFNVRLFETGRVFEKDSNSRTRANEYVHFCAVASGNTETDSWATDQKEIDFYEFKGYIEVVLEILNLRRCSFNRSDSGFFEPGFELIHEGDQIAVGGQFNRDLLHQFDIELPVFGFELNVDSIQDRISKEVHYEKPSDYPLVERDLSFVVPQDLEAAVLTNTLRESGGELLFEILLYDVYEGEQIPVDKKSFTYTLRFVSKERTLTEQEVDSIVQHMLSAVKDEHSAVLREE